MGGDVRLAGDLDVAAAGSAPAREITVLENTGKSKTVGTFAGLKEGARLELADTTYRISYRGGDGNDVVLSAVNSAGHAPAVRSEWTQSAVGSGSASTTVKGMTSDTTLAAALAAGPVVLDGGMSNQLESAGHDLSDELWSARLLAERPEAITEAHLAYFEAGADVVITSSYQATFEGFAKRGIDQQRAAELIALSVELAREAARQAQAKGVTRPLWVAASVGPYGAMLADGSEYRGRYGLSVAELEAFHRPRLEVLAGARPDVLALETVPDADEARALVRAVRGLGVPAWLSYTVDGDRTRAGQPLEEAFALAAEAEEIVAVGVNCCAPGDVDGAIEIAARVTGKPVVVYPNSGEAWDAEARSWTGRSSFTPEEVAGWRASGARLIGGCCRVGPEAIAGIAGALSGAGA